VPRRFSRLLSQRNIGVAHHQANIFLFEPETDRYLGRLCHFSTCAKGKIECYVPGCGREPFLKQHEDFVLDRDALAQERMVRLYDKRGGILCLAEDMPVTVMKA
jgi:hypothetical protein